VQRYLAPLFLQVIDLTVIGNRSERTKPTHLTVLPTVRSEVAHDDAKNTVRNDDRSGVGPSGRTGVRRLM
jgi:hypothetical protein